MGDDVTGESTPAARVEPATVFTALADIVYQGSSHSDVYAAICVAATLMVPGCDRASLLLRHGDAAYRTVAATDELAYRIDLLETSVGEGPCLDAIEEETGQIDPDLTTTSQWPELAARLVADIPVRGAMGFRLLVDGRKVGALNLFSDAANAFDQTSVANATVLAAFASVAINAAAHGEDATTLRRGLVSNREIGKAIGMMMVLNNISDDEAFAMLRRTSQDLNVKLVDVAAEFVRRNGQSMPGAGDLS